MEPLIKKKKARQCSVMKSVLLCITEEEPSGDVRADESIGQGASNQSWLSNEGRFGSAEEASQIQGIFKAELVFLTGSDGTDSDCLSREDEVDLSVKALPLLNLPPNSFTGDKGSSVQPDVGDESRVLLFQDAEQKLDGDFQESLFQAIDEAIGDLGESAAQNSSEEAHSQFLFEPGSLRQQSEELYAAIDQVLEDPLPKCCTSSALNSSQRLLDSEAYKPISPTPKSAGRETKYANLHLPSYESTENRTTRPGVIRPVTVIQKVPAMPKMEDNCPNPFRQHTDETNDTEIKELVNATESLNKVQLQRKGTERRSGRSPVDYAGSGREALVISEEEQEQAIK